MTQTNAPAPQPRAPGTSVPPPSAVTSLKPDVSAGPGSTGPDEVEQYQPELPFWHRKWVTLGMPVATAIIFHVGLFIAIVILAMLLGKSVIFPPTQQQVTVPSSDFTEQDPGGVKFTGLHNDPLHQAFQDKTTGGTVKGWADTKGPQVDPTNSAGGGSGNSDDRAIGMSMNGGGFGHGKNGGGSGTGDTSGSGSGEGGPLAMFGHPGGGGIGPQGKLFGNGGNALTIAYVCDASGSMMEKMEALKRELSKSVDNLKPFQKFSITFFQDKSTTYVDQNLILATPEHKRKAESFLVDVSTTGSTDPIPGLDLAFHQHPQLLYLLTDGDFDSVGNDKVLAEIHKLNADHKTKINTIAFVSSSDHDTDFIKLLTQIANESGGTFKKVNEEDLNN